MNVRVALRYFDNGIDQSHGEACTSVGERDVHSPDAASVGLVAVKAPHADEVRVVVERSYHEAPVAIGAELPGVTLNTSAAVFGCGFAESLRVGFKGFEAQSPELRGVLSGEASDRVHGL